MSDTTPEINAAAAAAGDEAVTDEVTDAVPSAVMQDDVDAPTADRSAAVTTPSADDSASEPATDMGAEPVTDVDRDSEAGASTPAPDEAGTDRADADAEAGAARAANGGRAARLKQLEREGEVAADFLETLLDIADLDGDLDVDVDGDRAAVAIVDSEEGRVPRRLVGEDGKVLEALQELTRLAVQVETGERSRLMLDVAGYRAERRAALVSLAQAAIAEVQASGERKALEPMSAFERKVVHDVVAAAGLVSESEGVDPNRHIIILPG